MRKLLVILMAIFFVLTATQAQTQSKEKAAIKETKKELKSEKKALKKLQKGEISYQSKENFYKDFGNLPNVQWNRTDYFDEATFIKDGNKMTAYYDYDSNLVGTTSLKTFTDLPARAQKEIKTKYKDYTIGEIIFFDDNEFNDTEMVLYGTQFEDKDNYFVELTKGNEKIIVRADTKGYLSFYKKL